MSRITKQFIYGSFFSVLIILAALPFVLPFFTVRPTCNDGIRNQDEARIDCGGPCVLCEFQSGRPPVLSSLPRVFVSRGVPSVLFSVRNSNSDLSVSFDYEVYRDSVSSTRPVYAGRQSLRALQQKPVFIPMLDARVREGERLVVIFSGVTYSLDSTASLARVLVRGGVEAVLLRNAFNVQATVINDSVVKADRVEVLAVLKNAFNTPIYAAYTTIDDLMPYEERLITVVFPDIFDTTDVSTSTADLFATPL